MTEIKACPYCGETDGFEQRILYGDYCYVACKCGARGPGSTALLDAVLLWNAAANALAKKDEEIEKLKQWLKNSMDEEKKRQDHAIERQSKLSTELQLEKKRVAAGDKRQDELEAEIVRLKSLLNESTNCIFVARAERDEARAVARKLYREREDELKMVKVINDTFRNSKILESIDNLTACWHDTTDEAQP